MTFWSKTGGMTGGIKVKYWHPSALPPPRPPHLLNKKYGI